ncbi:MAG: redox-regulated ATPase YchF [Candidatus Azambacteria bacterium]|nr:redox-regulated ATPase YchF [Candidatus Azambacteria bacterium]
MSLKIGIVGLPNVGKSTLFKALTLEKVNIANFPFATIDPNVGIVKVPDERLDKLAEISKSKKVIPTVIEFVDVAGLVKGAHEGAGLGNQFLARIREVDAIVEVVRDFEDPDIIHVEGSVSPVRDIETIQLELVMADLQTVNKRLEKSLKDLKSGNSKAQEEKIIIEKVKTALEEGELAAKVNLSYSELSLIKDLHLLTLKPFIFVFNMNNDAENKDVVQLNSHTHAMSVGVNLKFEEELADMNEEEAKEFKKESRLPDLIKMAYEVLGLITYFTTGEDETRGWTIKAGSTAPEAGAAIHTDFKEKFIKAEVINWQKLLECGSLASARSRGLLRVEGRDYVVCDGDVIEFKI